MTAKALSRVGQPTRGRRLLTDLGWSISATLIVTGIVLAVYVLAWR
jgi:hypothetical protein